MRVLPGVAVIVCSRDRSQHLEASLPVIAAAVAAAGAELLVVDSASSGAATAQVAARHGVRCVRAPRKGLARARNVGIAATAAEVAVFTDDDCFPRHDWVQAISAPFADASVGFVTGAVLPSDGEGTASVKTDPVPRSYRGSQDPHGIGHGANMAFRRAVLVAVGGFDEQLGAGAPLRSGEDVDMLARCLAAGWEGRYEPRAELIHEQWRDGAATRKLRYGYGLGSGAFRVKLVRLGVPRSGRMLARSFWRQGLLGVIWALRSRRRGRIEFAAWWLGGMIVGIVRALRLPLAGQVFR